MIETQQLDPLIKESLVVESNKNNTWDISLFDGLSPTLIVENFWEIIIGLLLLTFMRKIKKIIKTLYVYGTNLVTINDFPKRSDAFEYRQKLLNDVLIKTGDHHLKQRSLIGQIEYPNYYAKFEIKKGQVYLQMNARLRGKTIIRQAKFLEKCIVPYRIKINDEGWNHNVTSKNIVHSQIDPLFRKKEPGMLMIRGKVGCGKSTLVADICTSMTASNAVDNPKYKTAAIVVYVRQVLFEEFRFDHDFHNVIFSANLAERILDCLKAEIVKILVKIGIPNISSTMGYNEAINECYKNLISPLIVFDEIDYLYTDFLKRNMANKVGPDNKGVQMYMEIFQKLIMITDDTPVTTELLGCNTVYIVVARSSTKELISTVNPGLLDNITHIKIDHTDNESINEILKAQLVYLSETEEGVSKENIKIIVDAINNKSVDFSENIAISVHGVRHLINSIAKLRDFDSDDYQLLKHTILNQRFLKLYQYIDGNPDYSQAEEGISNIFLINSDAVRISKTVNNEYFGYDEFLLNDHLQSYWLKYFICEYVISKAEVLVRNNKIVGFNDVVNIFYSENSEGFTQYEQSIVRLAMLNASKVDHGRLFKFIHAPQVAVAPSSRLLYMKKTNMFWSFDYLMVIIEDKWLEFPVEIYDIFSLNLNENVHWFITQFNILEDQDKLRFLKKKVNQVLTFLLILDQALAYEKIRCHNVFRRLAENGIKTDVFIGHDLQLKESMKSFAIDLIGGNAEVKLNGYFSDFSQKKKSLKKEIKKSFDKYHGQPTFTTIEARMKKHFGEMESKR